MSYIKANLNSGEKINNFTKPSIKTVIVQTVILLPVFFFGSYAIFEGVTITSVIGIVLIVGLIITFEMIKKTFFRYYKNVKFTRPQTDEPYYSDSVSFPNWDDSSTSIADESAWQKWREEIMNSYGNVKIQLNPGADGFDVKYAEILDDKFNQERDKFGKGKAASIQRDQERGWSID